MRKVIMVSGGFDPLHRGHLENIIGASKLGNYLIVAVNSDEDMFRKKGYCYELRWFRKEVIEGLLLLHKINGEVVDTIDRDGTVTETLRKVSPQIFAKGGDKTPDNMPASEIKVCEELGIKIVYGVGGMKLNSSSRLKEEIMRARGKEFKKSWIGREPYIGGGGFLVAIITAVIELISRLRKVSIR